MTDLPVENLDDAIRSKVVLTCDFGRVYICRTICHGDGDVLAQESLECALILEARGVRYRAIDESVFENALDCLI
jgi:hypothetical protein